MNAILAEIVVELKNALKYPEYESSQRKLLSNYVFDEDRSVRWNREYVEKKNEEIDKKVAKMNEDRNNRILTAKKKIVEYIKENAHVGDDAAWAIFEFAVKNGKDDDLFGIGEWIDETISLVVLCVANAEV